MKFKVYFKKLKKAFNFKVKNAYKLYLKKNAQAIVNIYFYNYTYFKGY